MTKQLIYHGKCDLEIFIYVQNNGMEFQNHRNIIAKYRLSVICLQVWKFSPKKGKKWGESEE